MRRWLPSLLLLLLCAVPARAAVLGPQPIYYVALRWLGDPPFSSISAVGQTAVDTDAKLRYYSRNLAWHNYTVFGPISTLVPLPNNDVFGEFNAGRAAMAAAGIVKPAGTKVMFIYDPALYGGGGWTEGIGGDYSITRGTSSDTAFHENLHQFGSGHDTILVRTSNVAGFSDTGSIGVYPPTCQKYGWCTTTITSAPGTYQINPWGPTTTNNFLALTVDSSQPNWSGILLPSTFYLYFEFGALRISTLSGSSDASLDFDNSGAINQYLSVGQSTTLNVGGVPKTITVIDSSHVMYGDGGPPPDPNPPPQGDPNCTQSTLIHAGTDTWSVVNFNYSWQLSKNGVLVGGPGGWLGEPNPLFWANGVVYFDVTPQNQSQSGPTNWYKPVTWDFIGAKPSCTATPPNPACSLTGPVTLTPAPSWPSATTKTLSLTDSFGCPVTLTRP